MARLSGRLLEKTCVLFLLFAVCLSIVDCGTHRYTNVELQKKAVVTYPKEYETIIQPLDRELVPIRKQIFFLKHDVDEMKDKLWDNGTNQRIVRIDNNIDTAKKEISALSAISREILNTIYVIYPCYTEPEIVPYRGENKNYKKITTSIILVTLQDQHEYLNARSGGEKLSETIVYKPLIKTAMRQFAGLPDSLKPKIQPVGSPGPVRKLRPYTSDAAR